MHDCIIAGAGPVGLYTAKLLEKKLDVVVLEEHGRVGRPNHCSGLISTNLAKLIKVQKGWIENRVKGAVLHSPYGSEIRLQKKGTAALVINRESMDRGIGLGVRSKVMLNTRLLDFSVGKGAVKVKTSRGVMESKMLLGCDGANSLVARRLGSRPREVLNGLIALVKERDSGNFVELWFDKRMCDGFLWRIPRGKAVEYGGLGTGLKFQALESFFKLKKYRSAGGSVPLGPGRTYFDRALLIGDAAAQIKPWSGGGVVYGLTCARAAAEVVLRAQEQDDFSAGSLKSYEKEWKKAVGRGIRMGMLGRGLYKRLGNRGIEAIFRTGRGLNSLMNKMDMDFILPARI